MMTPSSLGPAVANHLWQTTAFVAAVWLVTLLLRRNSARIRYSLWLAASVKFMVPFSLLIGLGGLIPKPQHVVAGAETAVYSAVNTVGQPFSGLAMETSTVAAHASLAQSFVHALVVILLATWLCGVVVVLLVWFARWRQVKAMQRRAVPVDAGREVEILRRIDPRGEIPLLLSEERMEPGVFGIFRPVLIWPKRLSEQLDDEHIAAIMAHERMHVRRHDNLTAALQMVVTAVFWFHPMVWWMERRMVEERELACDEAVVEMGNSPETYAESLLKACRFCVESPLSCVAGITGADLNRRVRSIMRMQLTKLNLGKRAMLAGFGVIAVAGPVAFGVVRMFPVDGQVNQVIRLAQTPFVAQQDAASSNVESVTGPAFEVATVRPANRNDGRSWFGTRLTASGRFQASAESLNSLVWLAYVGAFDKEKVATDHSVPKWVSSEEFDIQAKVDDAYLKGWDKLSYQQRMDVVRPMIRQLLAERFHLKLRTEIQKTPVYALVQAKGGAHVKEVPPPAPVVGDPTEAEARWMTDNPGKIYPGSIMCSGNKCTAHAIKMSDAIGQIEGSSEADRIVIDQTGLKGYYDFSFTQSTGNDESPMYAVERDLGMKFERRSVPMKTYVIESAEKPSVDGS